MQSADLTRCGYLGEYQAGMSEMPTVWTPETKVWVHLCPLNIKKVHVRCLLLSNTHTQILTHGCLFVMSSGPEIRGLGRDELRHGEEPAVAEEEQTQGILRCCGL